MTSFTHHLAPCRAVLLDMDGTLVSSTDAVETAWTAWARANGVETAAVLAVCHGPDATTTVRRFLQGIGEAELAGHVAAHLERECADTAGVRPAPGALELVSWMGERGLPWGSSPTRTCAWPARAWGRPGWTRRSSSPVMTSSAASPTRRGTGWGRGVWGRSLGARPRWRTPPPAWRRRGPRGRSSWRWAGPGTATSSAVTCTSCAGSWPRRGVGSREGCGGVDRPGRGWSGLFGLLAPEAAAVAGGGPGAVMLDPHGGPAAGPASPAPVGSERS